MMREIANAITQQCPTALSDISRKHPRTVRGLLICFKHSRLLFNSVNSTGGEMFQRFSIAVITHYNLITETYFFTVAFTVTNYVVSLSECDSTKKKFEAKRNSISEKPRFLQD